MLPRFMNWGKALLGSRSIATKATQNDFQPNTTDPMQAKRDIIRMSPVFKASKLLMPSDEKIDELSAAMCAYLETDLK